MWTADEDLDDQDYPDEFDDEDDTSETVTCPECGQEVYEDAEQCPTCGNYFLADTNPLHGRSAAWLILGLLGVAAVIVALLVG